MANTVPIDSKLYPLIDNLDTKYSRKIAINNNDSFRVCHEYEVCA